jgi:hypothetical protein
MRRSDTLNGPDGRTSSNAEKLAKRLNDLANREHPVSRVRQMGYGPASFDVDLGEGLIATVSVDVHRAMGELEGREDAASQ